MIKNEKYKTIVMLGTSPEAHGGITTVVGNYEDCGALKKWKIKYVVTHLCRVRDLPKHMRQE